MEFKKYKMAMRNRISPKNRDFVIDRERAPFDDNVSNLGEQPVFSQNEFTTTPMIDPAEFPARKEYMQSYAVGGNVRQVFNIGGGAIEGEELGTREGFANPKGTKTVHLFAETGLEEHKGIYRTTYPSGKISYRGGYTRRNLGGRKSTPFRATIAEVRADLDAVLAQPKGKSITEVMKEKGAGKQLEDPKYKTALKEAYTELELAKDKGYMNVDEIVEKYAKNFRYKKGTKHPITGKIIKASKDNLTSRNVASRNISTAIRDRAKELNIYNLEKNKMHQALDAYTKIKNRKPGDITTLATKYNVDLAQFNNFITKFKLREYLPKNRDATKLAQSRAEQAAIKEYSNRLFEDELSGTVDIQKSHMSDKYNMDVRTGTIDYAPADINKFLANRYDDLKMEGSVDAILKQYTQKLKSLYKNKPKGYRKSMDIINQKGTELAMATKGFKKFESIDPYTGEVFVVEGKVRRGLDPTEILGNRKLSELDKTKGSYDREMVQYLKEEAMKDAEMSPKETKKTIEEIKNSVSDIGDDLLCTIGKSNTTRANFSKRETLKKALKAEGGRIGFKKGHTPECIEAGKKKIEEGRIGPSELNAVEDSLKQSGKMTPAAQKFFTAAKTAARVGGKIPLELISIGFGPAGVVAGALLELATVQDDLMRGDLKEAWRNTFPGMILKGAGDLVGLDLVGSKRKDILKFAKTAEETAAVNSMFNYLEGTEKFNEMLGDMESDAGDVSTFEQYQDPESQYMVSEASRRMYDLEDQARKLKAILDAQQKDLGTAEGQKMSIDVLRREIASRYNRALTNVSLEQFIEDEINRIYFDIQKQAAPIPDVIDPDTQFNLMNPVRQPFAGGGLSIQDKIQELLASIPGLMIADFVPVSEKIQLKRLFDQFNDRYMRKAEGGRIGFKNGPEDINKSRRLFNQLLLGLAALPVVGKYLKLGRGAAKVANITINKTAGMPDFFEPLVNKVINEGIDITKKMGTQERQTVHMADIADHEVTVYRQLDTGEIDVYINGMKTLYQDAVRLYYKPGQISEEASRAAGKPIKEADEFIAQESSPAYSGNPEDYEITSDGTFETNNFNELASDLTEVEAAVMKKPVSELQKRKKLERYKYYESNEGTQKLLDEQYGEYDDTMRDDIIDE